MYKERRSIPLIWAIAIIVVFGLLAGSGVYFWQKQRADARQSELQDQIDNLKGGSGNLSSEKSGSGDQLKASYFTIPEWGVRFKVSGDLQDLVYFVSTNKDGNQVAHFSTRSLMAADVAGIQNNPNDSILRHTCHPYGDPLASLARTSKAQPGTTNQPLGGYYYYFAKPQTACTSEPSVMKLENDQSNSLGEAIKVVEVVK